MRPRAQIAAFRRLRRRASAGFTLIELMVVVVLISVLTLLATPGMRDARDDRRTFDSARRIEQLYARARARAAGRGAAHLVVAAPGVGTFGAVRGRFLMFEALDGTAPGAPTFGPNPVSSCKGAGQWNDVNVFAPGAVSPTASIIDGFDLSGGSIAAGSVDVVANIQTAFFVTNAPANTVVMCITPGGATFVGQGGGIAAAVTDMQAQLVSFNSFVEIQVTRNTVGGAAIGNAVGLARRVIIPGGGAPRIKSDRP